MIADSVTKGFPKFIEENCHSKFEIELSRFFLPLLELLDELLLVRLVLLLRERFFLLPSSSLESLSIFSPSKALLRRVVLPFLVRPAEGASSISEAIFDASIDSWSLFASASIPIISTKLPRLEKRITF